MERLIAHVDMDAFYASVEQRDDPQLRGKPLIVGGSGHRGVVAAASYEVREFGVRSAMPVREALRRCPQLVRVAPRMQHYREVSAQVFEIFRGYTPAVEGLSLDEAFLDLSGPQERYKSPSELGHEIKQRIRERTGLTASVGMGPNKLVAKIASDLDKPDGLCVVPPQRVVEVLDPLPARSISGIGPKTAKRLDDLGILTIGDLRRAPPDVLRPVFGRYTVRVQQRAAGIDPREVDAGGERKSISSEETFDQDIDDRRRLQALLAKMADEVAATLRRKRLLASVVTVKIRTADFRTRTRQRSFAPPGDETALVRDLGTALLNEWLDAHPGARLRLLGVGVAGLVPARQMALFAEPRANRVDRAVDDIRARFGADSIGPAGAAEPGSKKG